MGKLIVSTNVTLDGVTQDPTGDEGFRHGGWFDRMPPTDRAAWAALGLAEALAAEALLLGRRSDAWFASRWTGRTGEWADRLNTMPKYVVSATLATASWGNATVLSGDVVDEVAKLRQHLDGDILVFASRSLVHTLLAHTLVDEVRLTVHPFILGTGHRLFGETPDTTSLRLLESRPVGAGLTALTYAVTQPT